jgi:hypothetical protein
MQHVIVVSPDAQRSAIFATVSGFSTNDAPHRIAANQ